MSGARAWPLVSAARMRELDRYTIASLEVAGEVLMESAGRSVVDFILARARDVLAPPDAEVVHEDYKKVRLRGSGDGDEGVHYDEEH